MSHQPWLWKDKTVDPWVKPLTLIHQIATPYCSVSNSHGTAHIDRQILPCGRLNPIETNSSPQVRLHLFSQTTVFVCPDKFLYHASSLQWGVTGFCTSSEGKPQAEKLQKVEIFLSWKSQCSPVLQLKGPIAFLIETESPAFHLKSQSPCSLVCLLFTEHAL